MIIGLPIAAAALCAYLADRVSRWLKQRYETSAATPAERSEGGTTLA
jgi:DNA-nicking Smr family endonuclease